MTDEIWYWIEELVIKLGSRQSNMCDSFGIVFMVFCILSVVSGSFEAAFYYLFGSFVFMFFSGFFGAWADHLEDDDTYL